MDYSMQNRHFDNLLLLKFFKNYLCFDETKAIYSQDGYEF